MPCVAQQLSSVTAVAIFQPTGRRCPPARITSGRHGQAFMALRRAWRSSILPRRPGSHKPAFPLPSWQQRMSPPARETFGAYEYTALQNAICRERRYRDEVAGHRTVAFGTECRNVPSRTNRGSGNIFTHSPLSAARPVGGSFIQQLILMMSSGLPVASTARRMWVKRPVTCAARSGAGYGAPVRHCRSARHHHTADTARIGGSGSAGQSPENSHFDALPFAHSSGNGWCGREQRDLLRVDRRFVGMG